MALPCILMVIHLTIKLLSSETPLPPRACKLTSEKNSLCTYISNVLIPEFYKLLSQNIFYTSHARLDCSVLPVVKYVHVWSCEKCALISTHGNRLEASEIKKASACDQEKYKVDDGQSCPRLLCAKSVVYRMRQGDYTFSEQSCIHFLELYIIY